jgi:hypothetical protein
MNLKFKIFEPDNKVFYPTLGTFLFLGSLVLIGLISYLDISDLFFKALSITLISLNFIYYLTKPMRYNHLQGKFNGYLRFTNSKILINHNEINIQDIKKIYIRANDFKGFWFLSQHPKCKSNGTNNLIDITLKNKESIKVFFELENKYDFEVALPFVTNLITSKIITMDDVVLILPFKSELERTQFYQGLTNNIN